MNILHSAQSIKEWKADTDPEGEGREYPVISKTAEKHFINDLQHYLLLLLAI